MLKTLGATIKHANYVPKNVSGIDVVSNPICLGGYNHNVIVVSVCICIYIYIYV